MPTPTADDPEHPLARKLRLQFEAQYGDGAPLIRAANHWFAVRTDYNEPWNRDRATPVTAADEDAAGAAMLAIGSPLGQARLQALNAAVAALYFDDGSDFPSALHTVVRSLDPGLADLLQANPKAAFDEVQTRLGGARSADPVDAP